MSLLISETLCHGTSSQIEKFDVTKGRNNKDFGKGLYMAVTKQQAIGMMHKKFSELQNRLQNIKDIVSYSEWLDFVLMCREQGGTPHNYDVVIGPTADDNTLACLRTYWQGFYGETGSEEAKEILLKNLEPENLGRQYFVGKQEVADRLIKSFEEISWR